METIAQLTNAMVSLGGRTVLCGIDLTLRSGECVGVAGPNGSGKTTLTRALATLQTIHSGDASILGVDTRQPDLTGIRRQIGLIGHHPALIPELTLAENLGHFVRLAGLGPERVAKALDVVGLAEATDRRAEECSFGMKRRVEIAHLLLVKPMLLLLDEAASGLDEAARQLVRALIGTVRARHGAALVVSHDRAHLDALCDTVFGLDSGRLAGA